MGDLAKYSMSRHVAKVVKCMHIFVCCVYWGVESAFKVGQAKKAYQGLIYTISKRQTSLLGLQGPG